jgi:hypothetical protein
MWGEPYFREHILLWHGCPSPLTEMGDENHSSNISDGGYLTLFEAVIMFALTQSEPVYYSQKFNSVNRLRMIRTAPALGYVRFAAVRNETAPPKVPGHVRVCCCVTLCL